MDEKAGHSRYKNKPRRNPGNFYGVMTRDSPPHSCYITNTTQYLNCQALIFQNIVLTDRRRSDILKSTKGRGRLRGVVKHFEN